MDDQEGEVSTNSIDSQCSRHWRLLYVGQWQIFLGVHPYLEARGRVTQSRSQNLRLVSRIGGVNESTALNMTDLKLSWQLP